MKFNKAIICLIAILSISTTFATVANQTATQQWWGSNANVKEAIATISTGSGYKFKCQIDNIEEKKEGGAAYPLGVAFNGFLQLSDYDKTGFMNYVQAAMKIENYNLNMQVLDYRLIQGCTVRDNANGGMFEKWKLMLDLHATEKYNVLPNADKKGIYSWKLELELPNMGKDDVMKFKKDLIGNCVRRNTQINKMKNDAIKFGLKYNTLYWDFENREQSLEQQAALVKSEEAVVKKVQAEQEKKKTEIDTAIAANKELLDSTIAGLKEAAQIKDNTEDAIEALATKLTQFQVKLTFFNDQSTRISVNIQNSKKQISDARALLDSKLTEQQKLEKQNAQIAKAAAAEKAAFDAALEKIRKQQEKVEAEKQANEAARAAEDAANAKATEANNKNIESVQGQIAKLEEKIKSAESLVADYQAQSVSVQAIIITLTKTVESKRSVAASINAQIKDLEREEADQAARLKAISENGDADIAAIKKRLEDQVKSVKFESDKLREEAEYYIKQAAEDIAAAKKAFLDSISTLNKVAAAVSKVTVDAVRNVLSNPGCESHINQVVASQPYVIKMALLRLAKYNKQAKALNEARFAQMQRVRMQRKSLKNKLRHHKNKY